MKSYLTSVVILLAVLFSQTFGLHSLYIRSGVFHIFMHIAGGLGIGIFFQEFFRRRDYSKTKRNLLVLLIVLVAGIVWEGLEAYYNISGYKLWTAAYYSDTAKDILNDLIGGAAAILIWG